MPEANGKKRTTPKKKAASDNPAPVARGARPKMSSPKKPSSNSSSRTKPVGRSKFLNGNGFVAMPSDLDVSHDSLLTSSNTEFDSSSLKSATDIRYRLELVIKTYANADQVLQEANEIIKALHVVGIEMTHYRIVVE